MSELAALEKEQSSVYEKGTDWYTGIALDESGGNGGETEQQNTASWSVSPEPHPDLILSLIDTY